MITLLIKRPGHHDAIATVMGCPGAGNQENDRRRIALQAVGKAQFGFVKQGIRYLAVFEDDDARLLDLFGDQLDPINPVPIPMLECGDPPATGMNTHTKTRSPKIPRILFMA